MVGGDVLNRFNHDHVRVSVIVFNVAVCLCCGYYFCLVFCCIAQAKRTCMVFTACVNGVNYRIAGNIGDL